MSRSIKSLLSLIFPALVVFAKPTFAEPKPLQTVDHVDLNSYLGKWYEIASIPKFFSRGCVNSQATYSLRDDGKIDVLNECFNKNPTGRLRKAKGVARVVDTQTNAKLKVSFFIGTEGDYWIIDLGENYEFAVVSEPNRNSLWILSRTEKMDQQRLDQILSRLETELEFTNLDQLVYRKN